MRESPVPAAQKVELAEPSPLQRLAQAAAQGDLAATHELLEALAPRIVRAVRAIVGPAHPDLDDVTQQALIAVVQAIPRFRGECEPASYAIGIAVRTAVAARRRARVHLARQDDAVDADDLPGAKGAPLDVVHAQRRKAILRDLLDALPPEQADALALKFVMGWSLEEVAAATGAPVNTVRSRMRLAKEALRQRIERDPVLAEELEVLT